MSRDNSNNQHHNKPPSPPPTDMQRNRRGSVTMPLVNIFQRSNSIAGTPVYPGAIATAVNQQRRLSLSTQVGLSGTSPTSATLNRRASLSTNSSDFDENVIEEEDSSASRTTPVTPFATRRVSFGTAAGIRRPSGASPGSNGRPIAQSLNHTASSSSEKPWGTVDVPPTPPDSAVFMTTSATSWKPQSSTAPQTQPKPNSIATPHSRPRAASDLFSSTRLDQGFNWSEQLRSRAESTVASGSRPSFSFGTGLTGSPPRHGAFASGSHDRAKSVSDMPAPPAQAPKPRSPPRDPRPKPDHFQERILKGDFYMD